MSFSQGDRADRLTGPRKALLERLLADRRAAAAATTTATNAATSATDSTNATNATNATDSGRAPVLMRPPGPARLILLHPSGGELFCYIPLVRALREGIGVAGFAADPRDTAVSPRDAMTATATRIARALTAAGLPESCCLAGWSYGGVLAFEIARQLERAAGERPPVVLLDAAYDEDAGPLDEPTVRRRFVHDVARLAGRDGPPVRAVLDDPAAGVADIRETLTSLEVELQLTDDELAGRYAIFRSCALALQAYRPPGPYGGPVTLLAAAPSAAMEEQWRAVCTGPFQCDDLPGDHYTLFTGSALRRIVAEIERTLPAP
jgi:thioesterase domain-containing protein